MATSKSAKRFLERVGLRPATFNPRPRLAVTELLAHTEPVQPEHTSQGVLLGYEGEAPTDRGVTKPWPDNGGRT